MSLLDFPAIRAGNRLSTVVGREVKLRKTGREFVGCCPFHADRTPSFTVSDDKGFFFCFGCGAHGDVLDFVQATAKVDLREAANRLGAGDLPTMAIRSPAATLPDKSETTEAARRIWREAKPINGTPAESYLRRRGIHMALPETLRFVTLRHPEGGVHPCLVASVISDENKLIGIQRTYLTNEGRKADVSAVKLSLGRLRGGAIRLAPADAELILTEGLEDALTLRQELGQAARAVCGAGGLSTVELPVSVCSVIIGADADETGIREARKAAKRFAAEGRRARIIRPLNGHKDFNSELIEVRS